MNATVVKYERLFGLGNFEHEKIGVEVVVGEGETASDAIDRAREFVELKHNARNAKERIRQLRNELQHYTDSNDQVKDRIQQINDEIEKLEKAQSVQL